MAGVNVFNLVLIFMCCTCSAQDLKFPDTIKFGTATASYQIEGAWNVSDKGENIWDHITHTRPEFIQDFSNGDIACNSYNLYKRDVEMLKELGVDYYRFSLSWTRILPTGFANKVSEDGIRYYNEVINELLANGIEPYITLYHWDLPQTLQDLGGWTNPIMADLYVDYARVVFENFADRVKIWFTFNEPLIVCKQGYGEDLKAPGIMSDGIGDYLCSHTIIMAHGKTYRMYEEEFKDRYPAKLGIADQCFRMIPLTSEANYLADVYMDFFCHWILDPIFTGDYPENMKRMVADNSKTQGFSSSRLPVFTAEQSEIIKGTADFVAFQQYGSYPVRLATPEDGLRIPSFYDDAGGSPMQFFSDWNQTDPDSFRWTIAHLKERYNDPEILITENGLGIPSENGLNDDSRVNYIRHYMKALLEAIVEDGARVIAYTVWSLMDNFEWRYGYVNRFGLYQVDFEDPLRTRTPKKSAYAYKEIISSRTIDFDFEPEMK